jgi:phosphoribosylglycinamide formyltransferase-1
VIGVLVSGSGTNLQALLDAELPVAAVASNVPGAFALERARSAGIDTAVFELDAFDTRAARDLAMAGWLEERGVRLVVCAGYMHLLTPAFLERFPGRVVNVHPSLLPAFPGAHAVRDALAAGVPDTGVTVHLVDAGLDTGPVLAQEPVAVRPGDSEATLLERLHAVEHRLLVDVARRLLRAL